MRKGIEERGRESGGRVTKSLERLAIIGRASAAGIPRESATWARPRMSTEICATVHYCGARLTSRLYDPGRWIDFGLSGPVGYLQDVHQMARRAQVRDRSSGLNRARLH